MGPIRIEADTGSVGNIDANPENADWVKRGRWDLGDDWAMTASSCLANGMTPETLDELPVMRWHPEEADKVRDAMRKLLGQNV